MLTAFPATIGGFGGVAGGQPCSFRHADILTRGFSRVPHRCTRPLPGRPRRPCRRGVGDLARPPRCRGLPDRPCQAGWRPYVAIVCQRRRWKGQHALSAYRRAGALRHERGHAWSTMSGGGRIATQSGIDRWRSFEGHFEGQNAAGEGWCEPVSAVVSWRLACSGRVWPGQGTCWCFMACKKSGVRVPLAPLGGLHVSVGPIFTFGSDIFGCRACGYCRT